MSGNSRRNAIHRSRRSTIESAPGLVIEALAADPEASINAAAHGWTETKAAYRFFDNPNVEPDKTLQPHVEKTHQRIDQHDIVLIVQDTTELDFTDHPPRDAGVLNRETRFGFYDHSHVAFTPDRLCLGVLDMHLFSRTLESLGKSNERRSDPIEEKESYRWLQGFRLACRCAAAHPETQIISLADCECDIYDVFLEAEQHPTPADFVIRARVDRSTPERDPQAGDSAYKKVRQEVASREPRTKRQVELPRTPKRAARTATLEIRAATVTVKPPHTRSHLPSVTHNVVLVEEVGGPGDDSDVSWLLITSLPIETVDDVLRVIDYYTARWPIEVFFRVYKTGCCVENIQLETTDRLRNALMMYKVICWRVMYVTFLGRECPELGCDVMFSEAEWKPVWKIVRDDPLPSTAPTLEEFIPLLAQLGGYNSQKHDGPPGASDLGRHPPHDRLRPRLASLRPRRHMTYVQPTGAMPTLLSPGTLAARSVCPSAAVGPLDSVGLDGAAQPIPVLRHDPPWGLPSQTAGAAGLIHRDNLSLDVLELAHGRAVAVQIESSEVPVVGPECAIAPLDAALAIRLARNESPRDIPIRCP